MEHAKGMAQVGRGSFMQGCNVNESQRGLGGRAGQGLQGAQVLTMSSWVGLAGGGKRCSVFVPICSNEQEGKGIPRLCCTRREVSRRQGSTLHTQATKAWQGWMEVQVLHGGACGQDY